MERVKIEMTEDRFDALSIELEIYE